MGNEEIEVWLGAALAIGRNHLGLSLKDACHELAGVSDKTLMKWESGERLHPLAYAIQLARRDDVTRSMLIHALGKDGWPTPSAGA
jgi:transcriptional regulator with XRE-family HTH domain